MGRRTSPSPRVLVLASRRPSLKRVHLGMYLGLTALVVAILVVHGLRVGPAEEAVPALGPPPLAAEPGSEPPPLSRYLADRARSYLRAVLPLLSLQGEDGSAPRLPGLARLIDGAVRLLGGVDLADPRTFLRVQVPLLAHQELPAVTVRAPAPPLAAPDGAPSRPTVPAVDTSREEARASRIRVAVYHTHASEAYLPAMPATAAGRRPQDAFSQDPEVGILRVGEELVRELREVYGIGAVQDRTAYDREGRLSSYERSAQGVASLLGRHSDLEIVLDLHRDEGRRAETTIHVAGVPAARVLIVVGTDRNLAHPNWRQNYALARRVVWLMEEEYPGLSRGIRDKDYRYNQHLFTGLLLVEVGCQESSLEEALHTARLLAAVVARLLAEGQGGP